MSWRGLLGLALLVAAAISGWAVWTQRSAPQLASMAQARADYLLHDFELVALDSRGREAFILRGPHLERHPGDRTMALATPEFRFPAREGGHWVMRARTGWVSADGDEVRLRGDVVAESPPTITPKLTFATQSLNVYPERNLASTPDVVTITRPGSILRGRGFRADLDRKRYALLADVHNRYAPTR
ncbi:LPS export ABC transporter periplasmic protein LptC [Vulcaniibacterium gelatinicum]|uniref:LPS export ABC transporter periplasmic protein LptC n=1 Tax=Vulcaniibacterium gelatinicum TaxID=2598725 RepID=UPI0011C785C9|nr:LPS export ABC transporter periplasmic protein LptC [Vulcaniibacterium gelatinicum]